MTEKNGGSQEPFLDVDAQLNSLPCYLAAVRLAMSRSGVKIVNPEEEPVQEQSET